MKTTGLVILMTAFFGIMLQACGSSHEVCPAYTKAPVEEVSAI